jgi:tRNA (uracil-5-)-methyltransferase
MLLSRCCRSRLYTNGCAKVIGRKFSQSLSLIPNQGQQQVYDALQIAKAKQLRVGKIKVHEAMVDRKRVKTVHASPQSREGSKEEVLAFEVEALLSKHAKDAIAPESSSSDHEAQEANAAEAEKVPERFSEIELDIAELSSTGEGLALSPGGNMVYIVPFTAPGDRVLARVVEPPSPKRYANTDFIKVIKASPKRNDAGIGCKYFSKCSGCQLQMLSYEDQLAHKKTILEKAYKNFSGLNPALVPPISDTYGSPLEYNYRTKLTPHFDGPPRLRHNKRFKEVPPIGFTVKGRQNQILDIEDCPIGSPIVREGLARERAAVAAKMHKYTKGATLLVRENTQRTPKTTSAPYAIKGDTEHLSSASESAPITIHPTSGRPVIHKEFPTYIEEKTYVSDFNDFSTEYIDDWKFTTRAGSFFQNNASILSKFTAYVRGHALPPAPTLGEPSVKYLLDAYCGSGLFAVTLSTLFKSTLGVDIDSAAVSAARANAADNNLSNIGFIEADAADLFAGVPFPPAETVVVIDPPRKGCSRDFLAQLLSFGPKRVVYVSCNVHSQARDVGVLVQGNATVRYEIESLRGFDFFPQTGHVEGVGFLNRVEVP